MFCAQDLTDFGRRWLEQRFGERGPDAAEMACPTAGGGVTP
jgi:hypothetical protein